MKDNLLILEIENHEYGIDFYDPFFFLLRDLLYEGTWETFAADVSIHKEHIERIHKLQSIEKKTGKISGSLFLPISTQEMKSYFKELNLNLFELKNAAPDGLYELAQDESESEALDEAIKLMDFVIETWPMYAKAYELKGTFLIEKGEQEKGIAFLKTAIEIDPTLAEAYSELGEAYYNLEDYEMAIEEWEKELEYTPYDKFAYFMIADAYRKMGKIGSAIDILKRFVSEDKKTILARYELMDLYNQLGEYDLAKDYEDQILKMMPYYPGDIESWAKVLFKNERYDEVIKVVEEHIQKYPIDSHFKILLVVPYAKTGRYDEAKRILNEFKNQKDWYFYGKKELFETNLSPEELNLCGIH
jgi:tetratricopeptide (TPR) repeat protein